MISSLVLFSLLLQTSVSGPARVAGPTAQTFGTVTTLAPALIAVEQTGIDNAQNLDAGHLTNPNLNIYFNRPTGTFGGTNNCLLVVAHVNSTLGSFGTPTDNIGGDTYTAVTGATGTQNNVLLKTWIVFGAPAGITKIVVPITGTFDTAVTYAGALVGEFQNGCTATGGTGFLGFTSDGAVHNLILSSAPTNGTDLVVAVTVDTQFAGTASSCTGNAITFSGGWTLLTYDKCFDKAAEYNAATSSTSVPIQYAGTNQVAMVGLVIKGGPAGTSPSGMYIDHEQATMGLNNVTTITTPFPSTGNLPVIMFNAASNHPVTAMSCTNCGSPTWTTSCSLFNAGDNQELVQLIPGAGAALTPQTTLTMTIEAAENGINPELLSITGANSSPVVACGPGTTGTQSVSANLSTDVITPTAVGHFLINQTAINSHTLQTTAADGNGHLPSFVSAVDDKADNANPTCTGGTGPATGASSLAGDQGYGILKNANTTAVTFIYVGTQTTGNCKADPTGVGRWSSITLEVKP